jgi:N6-L-threonylcarbamoyladenine synthase
MLHSKNFDFSFSGLKTAVLYLIRKIETEEGKLDEETKAKIALEFENAAIETLVHKTRKAVEKHKVKTVIVAGGVAANKYLRKEIVKKLGKEIKVLFPEQKLSTDNSIMIGMVGYLQFLKKKGKIGSAKKIKAEGYLRLK